MSDPRPTNLGRIWPSRCDNEHGLLFRKSEVFRYAMAGTTGISNKLIRHVSEQCVAAGRMMQIAISQYEHIASGQHGSFDHRTLPAWMFVSCSYSALDSLASAIASLVCGEVPEKERGVPCVHSFHAFLKSNKQGGHEIVDNMKCLSEAAWYKALEESRHRILHRGYWPINHCAFTDGWNLVHSDQFLPISPDGSSDPDFHFPSLSRGVSIDIFQIAKGLLWDLEEWEMSIADILALSPFIKSTWPGPVIHVLRLRDQDYLLPEACYLAEENDLPHL